MTLFVAEGLDAGEARPEEDESFELVRWPLASIHRFPDERCPGCGRK